MQSEVALQKRRKAGGQAAASLVKVSAASDFALPGTPASAANLELAQLKYPVWLCLHAPHRGVRLTATARHSWQQGGDLLPAADKVN